MSNHCEMHLCEVEGCIYTHVNEDGGIFVEFSKLGTMISVKLTKKDAKRLAEMLNTCYNVVDGVYPTTSPLSR